MFRTASLLLAMLLCGVAPVLADGPPRDVSVDADAPDVSAVIEGPDEGMAGNLVVLNSGRSKGDVSTWIVPRNLGNRYAKAGHQLFFAVREADTFEFYLIVVGVEVPEDGGEPQIAIKTAQHVYENKGGLCDDPAPPDEDPGDPEEPGDPSDPPGEMPELQKLSRDAAAELNDPPTAKALVEVLDALSDAGESLDELRSMVKSAVDGVFLARTGESRDADWLNVWRVPVNEAVDSETLARYRVSLRALADGIRQSLGGDPPDPEPAPGARKILMETRSGCGYCERWIQKVQPVVERMGFDIEYAISTGAVPVFHVTVGSRSATLKGYTNAERFEPFLRDLSALLR